MKNTYYDDDCDDFFGIDQKKIYLEKNKIKILKESIYNYLADIPIDFITKNVKFWELNRLIDKDHIKKLGPFFEENLLESDFTSWKTSPLNISMMKVQDNFEFEIIDGQHRIKIMKKLYIKYSKKKLPNIEGYLWFVKNEKEKRELFNRINNQKNLSEDDLPSKKILDVIENLDLYFQKKSNIHIYSRGGKRPYFEKAVFKNYLNDIDWNLYDSDDIIKLLLKINKSYHISYKNNRLNNEIPEFKRITAKSLEFAKTNKFYLGLNKSFSFFNNIYN